MLRRILAHVALAMTVTGCGREAPVVRPAAVEAQTVYKDPTTKRFVPRAAASGPAARLSTATTSLTEVAGPRGGRMVRLDGRFMNHMQATRSETGVVSAACAQPADRR